MPYLDQHGEDVTVGNTHVVDWDIFWEFPPAIDLSKAGMCTQLFLKYWYTKPGQPDTEKKSLMVYQRTFPGTMLTRSFGAIWEGIPWQQGQDPPPPGGGWTMNIKYRIASLLTWSEGQTVYQLTDDWNSGVYLHAM